MEGCHLDGLLCLLCSRCLAAMWTTAGTPITPGWKRSSSTFTWTERARFRWTSTTWWEHERRLAGMLPRLRCSLTFTCVFLTGHEQRRLSWVADGELQNQTGLKPKRRPALGGPTAQQQVLILHSFIPSHWKRLINPAAVEPSGLTHVYTRLQTSLWLLHTHALKHWHISHLESGVMTTGVPVI